MESSTDSHKPNESTVLFKFSRILPIFCLVSLPIIESEVLKFVNINDELSVSISNPTSLCLRYFGILWLGECTPVTVQSS